MKEPRRLQWIELEAFRGFAEGRRLALDADVVLVRGDNGSGKTSLIDGLIWLVRGDLPHLVAKVKGLRRTEDPVVNKYKGAPARVRLAFHGVDEDLWEFERAGDGNHSELAAWRAGTLVSESHQALAHALGFATVDQLVRALETWGVLRQDAVQTALESGAALHERLSAVVGLERVTLFSESAAQVAKDLKAEVRRLGAVRQELQSRHGEAQKRLDRAEASAAIQPDAHAVILDGLKGIEGQLPEGVRLRDPESIAAGDLEDLRLRVRELAELARSIAEHHGAIESASRRVGEALDVLERRVVDAVAQAREAAERAPVQAQLAAAALELLGDTCPVCGQPIDEATVREHLTEMRSESEASIGAAAQAHETAAQAQAQLAEARASEKRRSAAQTQAAAALQRFEEELARTPQLSIDPTLLRAERAADLAVSLNVLTSSLRSLGDEARRGQRGPTLRAVEDLQVVTAEVEKVESDLRDSEVRHERAAELERAAREAAKRIVERALRNLEPSFAEVFDRLSPHPTFTELRARQDTFYNRNQIVPEVYDPDRRISANPLLVYSEGQLNVVALSYFLGLALNAREGALPFLMLDDPLQSMDVLSVLGFADLCRRIREQRQLILTTHDRRYADVLSRKLAPREALQRTLIHEFVGWTREGPVIQSSEPPAADVLPLLEAETGS